MGQFGCLSLASQRERKLTVLCLKTLKPPRGAARSIAKCKPLSSQVPTRWGARGGQGSPRGSTGPGSGPGTLGTSRTFICASLQLPRDPDWPSAEMELWGGTCLIRGASCVLCSPLPAPGPWAWEGEAIGFVREVWAVCLLGALLPVMASFSKASSSPLGP